MEEIDLKELFSFIKTKIGLLVTIVASVCVIGCVYGMFIQKPMYKSDTTVILSSNNSGSSINQNDININKNLVSTYAEIVRSRRVLNQVIDRLDLDIEYDDLYEQISVTSISNTEIIKITVEDKDAIKAKNIANITAEYFTKEVADLYMMDNVDILDEAIEAEKPYNISVIKQTIIYFAIGLVLACGVLFLIFYFDRTVKSIEQVEQKIKLPILGGVQDYNKGVKKK